MTKILTSSSNGGHEFYLLPYDNTYLLIHVHGHHISYDKSPGFFAYPGYLDELKAAIENHCEGRAVVVCFMYAPRLGFNYHLFNDDDLNPETRKAIMKHIEANRLQILADSRKVLRIDEAESLIRAFRYSDAKTHCELYGLDFNSILEPIRKHLLVG